MSLPIVSSPSVTLVAHEGINLFLAGEQNDVLDFLDVVRFDIRFAAMAVKKSPSRTQPFARLKVKMKPGIISFRRDGASPLAGRAPAVAPDTLWHAGSRRGRTTPAVAWCCSTRAIARKSTTEPSPAR